MSNSHEPSYYEIALTNRQVIVAFILLLLCLIAAFFSGVWIGRESGARLAAEQMVRNAPPPEEKKEGQNLEELQFFDQTKKGKGAKAAETRAPEPAPAQSQAAVPAPAAAPSTAQVTPPQAAAGTDPTLGNDLGEDTEAAPRNPARNPTPTPTLAPKHQKPAPTPASAAPKTSAPAPEKVAAKPGKEAAARAPKKVADAAAEPAHAAGQVVIQVFSSAEKDQAVRIRDRLVGGGQKAYLSPVEVAGRTMYRVRIGPFDSRDQAQKVAEQVRKGYKLDTWVTE
ncbi:MAG TPA: SPOR domain-containing protein [Thermoanaerobaculia bacterium]